MAWPPTGRSLNYLKLYNLSEEEYFNWIESVDYKCQVCNLAEDNHYSSLHIDHDHVSNENRGILCTNCNTGIGHFKDSPELINLSIKYLDYWKNSKWEWIDQDKYFFKRSFWNDGDFKKCSSCEQWRIVNLWFKTTNKAARDYKQYRPYCTACNTVEIKRRRDRIPSKKRSYTEYEKVRSVKDSYYYNNFGITYEDFVKILTIQNSKCFICRENNKNDRTLAVDHCHESGRIRGLLCLSCNVGLGMFKEDVDIMNNAIEYLKNNREVSK